MNLIDTWRAKAQKALTLDLEAMWTRTGEWAKPVLPSNGERGGGSSSPSDRDLEDRLGDRVASRYHAELRQILERQVNDMERLSRLREILFPPQPLKIAGKHMLAAQIATEGWCVSCWRNDRTCNPIALRPTGEPYYKDRCRPCGEWQAEYGQDPPMSILKLRHDGRRVTQADVDEALKGKSRKAG